MAVTNAVSPENIMIKLIYCSKLIKLRLVHAPFNAWIIKSKNLMLQQLRDYANTRPVRFLCSETSRKPQLLSHRDDSVN